MFTQGKLKFKSTLISVYNHVLSPYFTSPTHRCYEPITFYFRVCICYYYIRDIRRPEPLSFCSANITSLLHYSAGTKIISFIMTLSHICIVVPRPSSHLRYPSILSLAPSSLQTVSLFPSCISRNAGRQVQLRENDISSPTPLPPPLHTSALPYFIPPLIIYFYVRRRNVTFFESEFSEPDDLSSYFPTQKKKNILDN